ncbi:MAG: hypothetical protein AAF628_33500 [Planctomycetota bacterium]
MEYRFRESMPFRPARPARGFPANVEVGQVLGGSAASLKSDYLVFVWNSHHDTDALLGEGAVTRPLSARVALRVSIENTATGERLTRVTDEFYLDQSLVETVAGGGVGDGTAPRKASMLDPVGAAVDAYGDLLVADTGNHRVRRVTVNGTVASGIETIIGNGFEMALSGTSAARLTSMSSPIALAADVAGNLIVAEKDGFGGSRLRYYERESGLISEFLGGFLERVSSICVAQDQMLYVADESADSIWRIDLGRVDPVQNPGSAPRQLVASMGHPSAVAALAEAAGSTIYVAKRAAAEVVRMDGAGTQVVAGSGTESPVADLDARSIRLTEPAALAVSPSHYYVADTGANLVVAVETQTNQIAKVIDTVELDGGGTRSLVRPGGLALDGEGNLFVVESGGGMLEAGAHGHQVLTIPSVASPSAQLAQELSAGDSMKELAQVVDGLGIEVNEIEIEHTPSTG